MCEDDKMSILIHVYGIPETIMVSSMKLDPSNI